MVSDATVGGRVRTPTSTGRAELAAGQRRKHYTLVERERKIERDRVRERQSEREIE